MNKEEFKNKLKDPLYTIKQEAARFVELANANGFRDNFIFQPDDTYYWISISKKKLFMFTTKDDDYKLLKVLAIKAFGKRKVIIVPGTVPGAPNNILVSVCTL